MKVRLVLGDASTRKNQIVETKKRTKAGEVFEFIYSESNNSPTLLSESHHLPLHPFLDFLFFKWAKNNNIPVGHFTEIPLAVFIIKRILAFKYYVSKYCKYDLRQYNKFVDVCFFLL